MFIYIKNDAIFSIFGVENIPSDVKYDKFDIRDNKNYFTKLDFFKEFFNNIKDVCQNKTTFLPLLRLPNLVTLLAFLDASYESNWRLKGNETTQSFVNEIKNFYSTSQAKLELEDMLQTNRLYKKNDEVIEFIRTLSNRDEDSYTIRETGKFLSDIINELKLKYEIKD